MDGDDDYLDEDMRLEDNQAKRRILEILSDHKKEIMNYVPPSNKNDMREKRMSKVQEKLVALSSGADIAQIPTTTVREKERMFWVVLCYSGRLSNINNG